MAAEIQSDDMVSVQVRNLAKAYQTKKGRVIALSNVDLDVYRGEFIALVGPSGCGKSTLLHIIAGLIAPDRGTISVRGNQPKPGRADVSLMFQRPVLLPWRTVLQNALLPIELRKMAASEAKDRAIELLSLVGLAGFEDKHTWELSGGMRQRLSLVQTLVTDAPLILMDEPFSAVDEFTRERLNVEVAEMHERTQRTTIYVTHNIPEAVFLADRVVAMKPRPGEIVEIIEVDRASEGSHTPEFLDSEVFHRKVAEVRKVLSDYTGGEE